MSVKSTNNCIVDVILNNYKVWPLAQFLNFYYIPMVFRLGFSNIVGFFWTIFVNYRVFNSIDETS